MRVGEGTRIRSELVEPSRVSREELRGESIAIEELEALEAKQHRSDIECLDARQSGGGIFI